MMQFANSLRILARGSAVAAFLFTLFAFSQYPRPWGSHWSPEKRIAVHAIDMGGETAAISLMLCVVAAYVGTFWADGLHSRLLRLPVYLNLSSLALNVLTPLS